MSNFWGPIIIYFGAGQLAPTPVRSLERTSACSVPPSTATITDGLTGQQQPNETLLRSAF